MIDEVRATLREYAHETEAVVKKSPLLGLTVVSYEYEKCKNSPTNVEPGADDCEGKTGRCGWNARRTPMVLVTVRKCAPQCGAAPSEEAYTGVSGIPGTTGRLRQK